MRGPFTSRAGGAALLLAWLAAVIVGAAAPAAAPLDPGLAAFLAAGGSLDDLCGGEGGRGHGPGDRHCDACRFLGPVLLPDPSRCPARRACFAPARAPAVVAVRVSSPWSEGAPRAPPRRS